MDYYSLFWGLGVTSTINEPWSAITRRSSTIAVLTDSVPFRGLLLTVLGSRSDFHDYRTPGFILRVGDQHSRFWPIMTRFMDYYSPFWGPEAISIVLEPPRRVYVLVIHTHSFGRFRRASWTITHCFGVPE